MRVQATYYYRALSKRPSSNLPGLAVDEYAITVEMISSKESVIIQTASLSALDG
jgi:hypothetical protein